MDKLYPPYIAGTLPSFYIPEEGATKIVVPFSMNKTVRVGEILGFSLRIKAANTDILYGVLTSNNWNSQEITRPEVTFVVNQVVLNKMIIGHFYKVQLAYIDTAGVTGFYSTVGIIKFTSKPTVEISDFRLEKTNVNPTEYIGTYSNLNDATEKAYQYCFNLYDFNNNILETSGWRLHNSYEDTELRSSIDRYLLKYAMKEDQVYRIQYSVLTNNNLQVNSPKYLVTTSKTIQPEIRASLHAEMDYDNACVNLKLIGEIDSDTGNEYAMSGRFLLTRASSLDDYTSWLTISDFQLTGELPSAFLLKDYTIMQGATYVYSLQQYNDYKIYSNRLLSEYVKGQFEDVFLFDGQRQLKIRFNPKISSFKTTVLDSKKTTIGGKYPFIFRNGIVEFKEFPINGLISYLTDNDEFFVSLQDELFIKDWKTSMDMTDENILVERLFKLKVLDWLNDGNIKLFKSPYEGNYIVRLMNVSLTPIDSVGRMLHNFSCQANEIADYNPENLSKYNLINVQSLPKQQMRWETIVMEDCYRTNGNNIYDLDLLHGYEAYHIKFTDMTQGMVFGYVDSTGTPREIMIGVTGAYEAKLDKPIKQLKLLNQNNVGATGTTMQVRPTGSITFSIISTMQNKFDTITNIIMEDIPSRYMVGPQNNILDYYNNIRRQVSRIHYAKFTKLEVREVYSPLFAKEIDGVLLSGTIEPLISTYYNNGQYFVYDIPTINEDNIVIHHYYRYYKGKLYAMPHYSTILPSYNNKSSELNENKYASYDNSIDNRSFIPILNNYTLYKDVQIDDDNNQTITYYRLRGDQLVPVTLDINQNNYIESNTYHITYEDLVTNVVYLKKTYDLNGNLEQAYYKFNGYEIIPLKEYSTKILYGNKEFDIGQTEDLYITDLDYIPEMISIGSGVSAEIGLQVKHVQYNVEDYCKVEYNEYMAALMAYQLAAIGLIISNVTKDTIKSNESYYVWEDIGFKRLTTVLQVENALAHKYLIYTANLETVSPENVDALYNAMIIAETNFINKIQEKLKAKEEGVIT